jgi:regulator of extracellular matrix RemA (YlzA/DUF370 family)
VIKDTAQKFKVIRYCVATGLVPFLEALVVYSADTGPTPSEITDVDVLGVRPADSAPLKRIIFDCKTLKTSAINRALWARGLASFILADEAFVILSKSVPEAHRLAGSQIGVRLFSEEIFDAYAQSANPSYSVPNSYIERPAAWETLYDIGSRYPALKKHLNLLQSSGPQITDPAYGIRSLVASLKKIEGEIDPEKPEHRAVFLLTCMQLLLFFSELVRIFHNVFDPATKREQFELTLRYYIWGGRENYDIRQRLKEAAAVSRGADPGVFELPGWDTFVEVFRSLLDAPTLVGSTCLPTQDLAFREISVIDQSLDKRLATRLSGNSRVRQFIGLAAQYVISASRLPRDFRARLNQTLAELASE